MIERNKPLDSVEEVIELIKLKIEWIYSLDNPMKVGGTASGVDVTLLSWHEFYADVTGKSDWVNKVYRDIREERGSVATSFADGFKIANSEASEREVARFVVDSWSRVSSALGMDIGGRLKKHGFDN